MEVNEIESTPFIERLIRYGNSFQENKNAAQNSLFGNMSSAMDIAQPKPTPCDPWDKLVRLKIEKDLIGLYLSGHPLDQYRMELENFCTATLDIILTEPRFQNKDVCVGGIITAVNLGKTQRGDTFARFTLEDYNGSIEMALFSKDYITFAPFLAIGNFIYLNGKVQLKWKSESDFELKPSMFKLLSEIKGEKTKGIQLNIDIKAINEGFIQHLEEITQANVGKYDLKVNLKGETLGVELFSRKIRVDTSIELLSALDKIEGLTYKILAS